MKRILIANRGEIASRIIKTCKKMGIETIAVYSDADEGMPYVKEAHYAVHIGESPVNRSYLNMNIILETAIKMKADGIHPGYGLLSENSDFAQKAIKEGLIFIGPSPETIKCMGDKITARTVMKNAGVPIVPGSNDRISTLNEAITAAKKIGYPVMLKASSGGGGIGMICCENEEILKQVYESTKNRAKAYFGDDTIFIEKFIPNARHIEVQIFGDKHGNIVHLFERNCSVQRRNQKVIEEAPSPSLSERTKALMYKAALTAAKVANYVNAGTVEFIVGEDELFYFLEMNTRLQVEHPVTEEITGLDLVEWQILIARSEKIPLQQHEIRKDGHAVELRIYAEDPITFYPSPGLITGMEWHYNGVRIDSGYTSGSMITPFYDPMIAKCIIHGPDRNCCIEKAKYFLAEAKISGIKTNIPYLERILSESKFQSGIYNTNMMSDLAK
ncbi:acetyl-CoA carboxylase biotin carboxylase subunit [Lederbergia citrea]|uniref:acetyl-CoA carboxylase biotin carboxylase subunit n=1 Tax=Lederbergia citrea TaxID=2833581 RepID=UPI001BCA0C4F|nr:ATP-grasp domain-containing protein [Lederbergia citrea]